MCNKTLNGNAFGKFCHLSICSKRTLLCPLGVFALAVFAVCNYGIAAEYMQDFEFADGTTDLGDGSIIASSTMTNGEPTAQVVGGRLRLTEDNTGSTSASFKIPSLGADATQSFIASFDFELFDAAGGNPPADGFSFNFGPIGDGATGSEEGFGVGLSIEFDTWDNGGNEIGYNVGVNNVDVPNGFNPQDPPVDGMVHNATILWSGGAATLVVDEDIIFSGVPTVGFAPAATDRFAFAARTGGATEDLFIDNLIIQAPIPGSPGDFNSDGAVDLLDYNLLLANFLDRFSPIESFSKGDNNRDGKVDFTDFSEFRLLFEAANPGGAAVPEPSTALLMILGATAVILALRRKT